MTTGNQLNGFGVRLDLYVSDINGSDTNDGLVPARPLKTLARAKALYNGARFYDVVVHIGAHAGTGYAWATVDNVILMGGANIYFTGDGAGQAGEDGFIVVAATTAADAGSGTGVVVDAGLVADAYRGFTIEILTGAAAGNRRTVNFNTTTNIVPTVAFSAAVAAGDTYRIVRPAVAILVTALLAGNNTVICSGVGNPRGPLENVSSSAPTSTMYMVNIAIGTAVNAGIDFWNSSVTLVGVQFMTGTTQIQASGEIACGETSDSALVASALVVGGDAWHGWAVSKLTTTSWSLTSSGYWHGMLVGFVLTINGTMILELRGGHLRTTAVAPSAALQVFNSGNVSASGPSCRLGGASGTFGDSTTGLTLEATGTGHGLRVIGTGTHCTMNGPATQPITISSVSGSAIVVQDFGDLNFQHLSNALVTITAGTFGVVVLAGGRAGLPANVLAGIVGTTADLSANNLIGFDAALFVITSYASIGDASGSVIYRT